MNDDNKELISAILSISGGVIVPIILLSIFHSPFIVVPVTIIGFAAILAGIIVLIRRSIRNRKQMQKQVVKYVGCLSSHTFHRPSCRSVKMLARENRVDYGQDISSRYLQSIGMKPCTKCKPRG